jgi:hypothetical protein
LFALFLVASACAPLFASPPQKEPNLQQALASPTPSSSPTPITPLAVSTPPFHAGEVGVDYTPVALAATGGAPPYTWSISDGALPGGLTLGDDAKLAGTPTSAGSFKFTVQATDSSGATAGLPGTIGIAAALGVSLIPACASVCTVELGCDSTCGPFGQLSGGVGPYTYSRSGPLPNGTTLSGLKLTGTFTGIPGYVQFTVTVTDKLGGHASVSPTFRMLPHIFLASGSCMNIFSDCTLRLKISGGSLSGTPSVRLASVSPNPIQQCWPPDPTPPPGYTLTVSGGYVVVYVPRPGSGYAGIWSLIVTDHNLCAASTFCKSPAATATIGIQCT